MKKAPREDRYVVGYKEEKNCIYGKARSRGGSRYVMPLTASQAQKALKTLCSDAPRTVFKLVPVKLEDKG